MLTDTNKPSLELARAFTALSPVGKAHVLARLTHKITIDARAEAYVVGDTGADGVLLRQANEWIHRLSGYMMQVLADGTQPDQDASFVEMLFCDCNFEMLRQWIRRAETLR